ncbi:MAG: hypothetical protein ACTS7D_01870 [Candidatus Hodgkinia cicadicola]
MIRLLRRLVVEDVDFRRSTAEHVELGRKSLDAWRRNERDLYLFSLFIYISIYLTN